MALRIKKEEENLFASAIVPSLSNQYKWKFQLNKAMHNKIKTHDTTYGLSESHYMKTQHAHVQYRKFVLNKTIFYLLKKKTGKKREKKRKKIIWSSIKIELWGKICYRSWNREDPEKDPWGFRLQDVNVAHRNRTRRTLSSAGLCVICSCVFIGQYSWHLLYGKFVAMNAEQIAYAPTREMLSFFYMLWQDSNDGALEQRVTWELLLRSKSRGQ